MPALGYATYYYKPYGRFNLVELDKPPVEILEKDNLTLENEKLRVEFDCEGRISCLKDKATGKDLLKGVARAVVIDETEHDTWSHGRNYFDKEIGEFAFQKIEKIEGNAVRTIIKVSSAYGNSTLAQYYTLNAGDDVVRVRVKLDWREKHKMLKFVFPVNTDSPRSFYEIPFMAYERPCNGEEEAAHTWAMVGDENLALAVLNDCKYSYSAKENELALTAIRSPIYCDHGLTRTEESNYTDQGLHEFFYALTPASIEKKSEIFRKAHAFNTPLTHVLENHHEGKLPLRYEGIAIFEQNILVSAIKKAEDNSGYVFRAYECEGKATSTTIEWKGVGTLQAAFKPYEIKTWKIENGVWKEVLFTEYEKA